MSKVWENLPAWVEHRRTMDGRSIGFVPTMGALHHGHASLIQRCRKENEIVVVSIFINPTQFNDPADLRRYPRTRTEDLSLLESIKVDEVLIPTAEELYPEGYRFRIEEGRLTQFMEGVRRPGYLQGVMTVVLKLLNLVRARRAYFGEKDYQQLQIIKDMVKEFFIPTEIIGCSTVREGSGLAASSRNVLLSTNARERAALIAKTISNPNIGCEESAAILERAGFSVEYVEEHFGRRFVAAWLDGVRLIDNAARNQTEA